MYVLNDKLAKQRVCPVHAVVSLWAVHSDIIGHKADDQAKLRDKLIQDSIHT